MSPLYRNRLTPRELHELRATLLPTEQVGGYGDLGRAVMSAYGLWYQRVGGLAPIAVRHGA